MVIINRDLKPFQSLVCHDFCDAMGKNRAKRVGHFLLIPRAALPPVAYHALA
jgi:hypothetical protein